MLRICWAAGRQNRRGGCGGGFVSCGTSAPSDAGTPPRGTYPLCDVSKVVSLGPRTFFVFSPQIPRQQTHISDQKRDVGHPACSRFSLSGMSPIGTFHQPTPSPPAFDSKIFFLKGFDSNLDTNQIRFWFWRFEWVETQRKHSADAGPFAISYSLLPVYQAHHNSSAIHFILGSGLVSGLGTGFCRGEGA